MSRGPNRPDAGSPSHNPRAAYSTAYDILFNALVSDSPEMMQLDQLPAAAQSAIAGGRSQGLHLVCVRWPTGEFAHMFCQPGSSMPSSAKVIAAFHQSHWASTTSKAGDLK